MNHPPGSFCFAELVTPDAELGTRFYTALFGWEPVTAASGGDDLVFRLRHVPPAPERSYDVVGLHHRDGPHRWVAYATVENVDRTVDRALGLGATIVTAPFDREGLARTCVIADPEGAELGLWESRGHRGADLQDETGSMWWVELMARDVNAARRFYTGLFGWSIVDTLKYGPPYTVFKVGDVSVSGAVQFGDDWGVSPRWQVFFAVDDILDTVKQAEALGGTLEFEREVPATGSLSVLRDPANAVFVVMQPLIAA